MGKIQSIASRRQEVKQRPNVTQQDWFFLPLSQQRSKKGAANLLNQTLLSQSSITKNKDEKCLGFPILPNGHTPKIQINSSCLSPGSAFQQSNKLVSVSLQILKEELECVSRKHCILELWRQANKKCSDVTVRNGHIKPQGKYDSEKQLSDHPGDFTISGMTTCGPHKAEQAARRLFFLWSKRLWRRAEASGGSSQFLFNYFFYVNFQDQEKCVLVLYNNHICLIKLQRMRKWLFSHRTSCLRVQYPDLEVLTWANDCSHLHCCLKLCL